MPHSLRNVCTGRFLFGLLVVSVGILVTLDNLGVLEAGRVLRYWPVGLILIGLAQIAQAVGSDRRISGAVSGAIWMFVGTWLLLQTFHVVHVSVWALWPLVLVAIGLSLVWRALTPAAGRPPGDRTVSPDTDQTISAFALMSGVERTSAASDFRGADLTAVMGGVQVDLRQATIAAAEAVVDVFAVWGGIELRVPDRWVVVNRVAPILGGVEQKTRTSPEGVALPRLIVRGTVVMGGVEIKN